MSLESGHRTDILATNGGPLNLMEKTLRLLIPPLLLGLLTGCADHLFGSPIGTDGDSPAAETTFPADISNIWTNRSCTDAGCHGGGAAGGGVALEEFDCEQSVVDGYAIAGSAATSPLWLEVNEETMPLSGGPLTQEEKDAVAAWIDSGALCEGGADTGR